MNETNLCLNVDIKENLNYPDWGGGTEAPTLGYIAGILMRIFIGINNI